MQNLRKLSVLIIMVLCANYGSTLAQCEQKAFKEGDKILSIGIGAGYGQTIGIQGAMGIAFEKAIKGTNGILSIGGFANFNSSSQNFLADKSIFPYYITYSAKVNEFSGGVKFGIHYATRKLDLYGGLMLGGGYAYLRDGSYGIKPEIPLGCGNTLDKLKLLVNPYFGTRYYLSNKVGLHFEVDSKKQSTIGISFKF